MTTQTQTRTSTWTLDPTHSIAEFSVKHLVVTTVKGRFREVEATLNIDEDNIENSSVTASIDVASIDTNLADRDAHLRSDDFFNAEQYPKIKFQSTRVEKAKGDKYMVHGDLTIRDVTRPVELDAEFEGEINDPWGNRRAAFTATTQISRKEFNVRWNQALETGGAVVSDNVKITLHIEAVEQK
jgi:polyisoprenoid-binding protein YceI